MAINNLSSLKGNKERYTENVPEELKYYLSSDEYNLLIKTLQELINDYNYKMGDYTPLDRIRVLKTQDSVEATDENVFSSLNTLEQIQQIQTGISKFFLKKTGDEATGLMTFEKGIQFKKKTDAIAKWFISEFGDAKVKSLTIDEWLEVPELRYNRVEVNIGDKWRAPGGGVIESVDTATRTVTLKLEEGEFGAVSVGDLCMGIFHSMEKSDNATVDKDDGFGNRQIKGFATSYFRVDEITETDTNKKFRYSLRPLSPNHSRQFAPQKYLHFVAYGNDINENRQSSAYETRTYQRFLKGVNDWEYKSSNIAAQFGDLSNLAGLGINNAGGHSIYLSDVYFSGTMQQMQAPKIQNGTWHIWNGVEWVDTEVPATPAPVDGLYADLLHENISAPDLELGHSWNELRISEGDMMLDYVPYTAVLSGTYTVTVTASGITPGNTESREDAEEHTYMYIHPAKDITSKVAYISYRIQGVRLDGVPFSFTKKQSISQVESGKPGDRGPSGPLASYRGPYSDSAEYVSSVTRTDIVVYNHIFYKSKYNVGTFSGETPSSNSAFWELFGGSYESIATKLLLAEEANVAGFIFKDETLQSQSGKGGELGEVGFNPNIMLDGVNGIAKLGGLHIDALGQTYYLDDELNVVLNINASNIPSVKGFTESNNLGGSVINNPRINILSYSILPNTITVNNVDNAEIIFTGTIYVKGTRLSRMDGVSTEVSILKDNVFYRTLDSIQLPVGTNIEVSKEANVTLKNVPRGVYSIMVTCVGGNTSYPENSSRIGASTLKWKYNPLGHDLIYMGKNGLAAKFGETLLHVTSRGIIMRGVLDDTASLLFGGSITETGLIAVSGDTPVLYGKFNKEVSTSFKSPGEYKIHHNIGHLNYSASCTSRSPGRIYHVKEIGIDFVEIIWQTASTGTNTNTKFDFVILGETPKEFKGGGIMPGEDW